MSKSALDVPLHFLCTQFKHCVQKIDCWLTLQFFSQTIQGNLCFLLALLAFYRQPVLIFAIAFLIISARSISFSSVFDGFKSCSLLQAKESMHPLLFSVICVWIGLKVKHKDDTKGYKEVYKDLNYTYKELKQKFNIREKLKIKEDEVIIIIYPYFNLKTKPKSC